MGFAREPGLSPLEWWAVIAAVAGLVVSWAVAVVAAFARRPDDPPLVEPAPTLTLIRPFRGLEPDAERLNDSLLQQDYPRLEVLFVCEDEDDPGRAAADAACARFPGRGRVVISRGHRAFSGKVRNMMAGWAASTSELVAFCDADVFLANDDLATCVRAISSARVGGAWMPVVCEEPGLHGALWLLITAVDGVGLQLAAERLGGRATMQGGLMIMRRAAIDEAGGIGQLGDTFADDLRAGNVLQRAGFEVRPSVRLLRHQSPREPVWQWLLRFHRWANCVRSEAPFGFFLQLFVHPIAAPLVALVASRGSSWSIAALVVGVVGRASAAWFTDCLVLRPRGVVIGLAALARPLADLTFFALSMAALVFPFVRWRGRWYRLSWRGRIAGQVSG